MGPMSMQPSLSVHENLAADEAGAADDEGAADDDGAADELLDAGAGAAVGDAHAAIKPSNATSATNNTNLRILSPP